MKILAFDSVAKVASCAIADGERVLASYSIDNGLTQSELLMPMAEDIVKSLGIGFEDIDLLACTVGPGSFTGVRIGVALVKGIAFGRNIPCIGISALDALAENASGLCGIILPCMDARRRQVYTAIYRGASDGLTKLTEDMAISLDALCEMMREYADTPVYVVGDGAKIAEAALTEAGFKVMSTPRMLVNENAYSCALLAKRKYDAGEHTDDLSIAPTYLRLPQAERERLEREKSKDNSEA